MKVFFSTLIYSTICLLFSYSSMGQSKKEKLYTVIDSLDLVNSQKQFIESDVFTLKQKAKGQDSLRLIALEERLNSSEIKRRIYKKLDNYLTEAEVNDLFQFIHSTAYSKLKLIDLNRLVSTPFKADRLELEAIAKSINVKLRHSYQKQPKVYTNRIDGFYTVVDYTNGAKMGEVTLQNTPSITTKEIKKVEKLIDSYGTISIQIVFTEVGSIMFHELSKNNINKPIAIVVNKEIIAMPLVYVPIDGGKVTLAGNFSETEIEEIIRRLRKK